MRTYRAAFGQPKTSSCGSQVLWLGRRGAVLPGREGGRQGWGGHQGGGHRPGHGLHVAPQVGTLSLSLYYTSSPIVLGLCTQNYM